MYWYVGYCEKPSFVFPPSPYDHDHRSIAPPDELLDMIEASVNVMTSSIQLLGTSMIAFGAELTFRVFVNVSVASRVFVKTYWISYSPPGRFFVLIRKLVPSKTIRGPRIGSVLRKKVSSCFDAESFHSGIPTIRSRLLVPEFSQITNRPNSSISLGCAMTKSICVTGFTVVVRDAEFVQPLRSVYVYVSTFDPIPAF